MARSIPKKTARKHIIALHRAGMPIEQLARDAPRELGVRARFVYRVLGYEHRRNPKSRKFEWVKPMEGL